MLTGFTPYWSDALLLVPQGRRAGVRHRAVEARVGVDQHHRSGERDRQHAEAGHADRRAAGEGRGVKRVGVLEFDALPAGLADDLAAAAPAVEWTDGTALFAGLRREVDDAERGLLARADAIAVAALRRGRAPARPRTPARSRAWSSSTRGSPAPRKPTSRSRPISPPTAGSTAPRSRRRWRTASRCAPRSPTRAAGSAARARSRRTARGKADAWFDGVARSLEAGKPIAAQLAAQIKELARRDADEAGWPKAAPAAIRCRPSHHRARRQGRAGDRPIPGADRRADARRRAVDRRRAADRRQQRALTPSSLPGLTRQSMMRRDQP